MYHFKMHLQSFYLFIYLFIYFLLIFFCLLSFSLSSLVFSIFKIIWMVSAPVLNNWQLKLCDEELFSWSELLD